jgi:superfamily II DNA or RNA helicase
MTATTKPNTSELFIVDNSDAAWKVKHYLHEWADLAHSVDIATGYFEIGALLALDGQWQKLQQLRILMGAEVSRRTRNALIAGVTVALDDSIEKEKESNDFLHGVPAIVDALRRQQIVARVYTEAKFHAKAYITHSKYQVMGSAALVGSSNFTVPGLTENIELNLQIRREVEILQQWYELYWNEAQDITPEILRVIERHTTEYMPFEVYAKALQEYFRGHEVTAGEWELAGAANGGSRIYPILNQYQKEGYQALMKIANTYNGALLCDGVGLGKTFIGMMVIERLAMYDRKRVALFVPKVARKPVWEKALKRYLPHLLGGYSNLLIFSHTDLSRGGEYQEQLDYIKEMADIIVIDEAHHFRIPGIKGEGYKRPSRYRRMYDIIGDKTVFMLTATPVNNRLIDLQHMIELFSRQKADYFRAAPLGIHSLAGHFRKMEKALDALVNPQSNNGNADGNDLETNEAEAEQVLHGDTLFQALVVQRSRAYAKASQHQHGGNEATFPMREDPKVAAYSIKKTYGKLLAMLDKAFSKDSPLFSLAIYYPLAYYQGEDKQIDPLVENRQKAVVSLIRTQFLKRFESSAHAFERSCDMLLLKLLAWITKHSQTPAEVRRLARWKDQHADLVGYVQQMQWEFSESDDEADEDIITEEMLEAVEELSREEYQVEEILAETFLDLDQIAEFLEELRKFKPSHDDKLQALIKLIKSDQVMKHHKVLIFTEFSDTARYLKRELIKAGIEGVDEVDSGVKRDRGEIIRQFAPYYNESSSGELAGMGLTETRVLIATDVLSEGLNLQDATRLINYDLHWNPVRLMQRIGRVDRRINTDTEQRILADHPDQKAIRGTVAYWNFLPPDEVDDLLRLYGKVSHKTLKISKTFGIEGRKLLRPDDDYEALRDFNHAYEGTTTLLEAMHLEYQQLLKDYPDIEKRLANLPGRVFTGKANPKAESRAVFFCYALPAPAAIPGQQTSTEQITWTEEAGYTKWYLYDLETEQILDDATAIVNLIRSTPQTPRQRALDDSTLSAIRAQMDKHIKNTYLRTVQAPVGIKATLKAWMELS